MSKSESARINGAKSHGPKTEAGRKRSSQNALKHGLTAETLLLPSEDPGEFHQLLASYLDHFQPAGPAELDLVHEMVAAKWRLERLAIIETQLYADAMDHIRGLNDHRLTPAESLTKAFERLANSNSYPFLHRTASRLERTYSRALRNLIQLQRLRQSSAENEICKNEPTEPIQPNGNVALDPADAPTPAANPAYHPQPHRGARTHACRVHTRVNAKATDAQSPPRNGSFNHRRQTHQRSRSTSGAN